MSETGPVPVLHAGDETEVRQGTRREGAGPWAPVARLYRRVRTKAVAIEPARLELAVIACRPAAFALALVAFVIGFSVDDLRVLRLPGYLVGAVVAFLLILLGPLAMGRTFAQAWVDEPSADFQARAGRARRLGLLRLLVAALAFVAWLVVFSAGVPPWAR